MSDSTSQSNDTSFVPTVSSAADRIDALLEQGILAEPPHPGVRAGFKRFHVLRCLGETTVKEEGVSLTRLRSLGVLDESERGMKKVAILNSSTWTSRPRWIMQYEAPEPSLWSKEQREMIINTQKYLKEYGHILVEEKLLAP